VLEAPRDAVHNQAFNVGRTDQNFRVREVAEMVEQLVPGSHVRYAEGAGPDPRCYRVACDKLPKHVPAFRPTWTVRRGIEELAEAYRRCGLRAEDFEGERYVRLRRVRGLMSRGKLDADLRWV
jgi:nucleoside-diphosphate-sugar epimerase